MLKNTITVLVQVDHITNPNLYLSCLSDVISQKLSKNLKVDIVTLMTNQIHPDVQKIYNNIDDIKSRFEKWPEQFELRCFLSDDHSFQKIRNFTDNLSNGEFGELVTFKSVAPINWYPHHLNCHWDEYKNNKDCGWMLSRIEIKDLRKADNEKENTIHYRLEEFPKHIDQIVPDEVFISYNLMFALDFNVGGVMTRKDDGTQLSYFHIGKFVTEDLIPKANDMKLKGYNPEQISIIQWIDIQTIQENNQPKQQDISPDEKVKENEDGSISFISEVDESGATVFLED